jgi:hypothetical protein
MIFIHKTKSFTSVHKKGKKLLLVFGEDEKSSTRRIVSFHPQKKNPIHPSIHPSIHEDHILEILMCFMLMDTELWFCASQNQSHPVFILSLGLFHPLPTLSMVAYTQCKEILLNLSMKC